MLNDFNILGYVAFQVCISKNIFTLYSEWNSWEVPLYCIEFKSFARSLLLYCCWQGCRFFSSVPKYWCKNFRPVNPLRPILVLNFNFWILNLYKYGALDRWYRYASPVTTHNNNFSYLIYILYLIYIHCFHRTTISSSSKWSPHGSFWWQTLHIWWL